MNVASLSFHGAFRRVGEISATYDRDLIMTPIPRGLDAMNELRGARPLLAKQR